MQNCFELKNYVLLTKFAHLWAYFGDQERNTNGIESNSFPLISNNFRKQKRCSFSKRFQRAQLHPRQIPAKRAVWIFPRSAERFLYLSGRISIKTKEIARSRESRKGVNWERFPTFSTSTASCAGTRKLSEVRSGSKVSLFSTVLKVFIFKLQYFYYFIEKMPLKWWTYRYTKTKAPCNMTNPTNLTNSTNPNNIANPTYISKITNPTNPTNSQKRRKEGSPCSFFIYLTTCIVPTTDV